MPEKLTAWTAHCEVHGQIEVHQDTTPARCHRPVRRGVTCNRLLQRVKTQRTKERREP